MKYKIKKKLIHFYTSGNIAEDFVASRRKKVSALRKIIRICFYLHCAAALLCIGLSILLGSSLEVVGITVCTVAAAWVALFAVSGIGTVKLLLIAVDIVLAAAGFVTGAFTLRAVYFCCGAIMIIAGVSAIFSYFAARCKDFLEGYSPRLIRRDDYTLMPNFSSETEDILPALYIDEEVPPLPPLTSEMRELAMQLNEVLNAPSEKEPEDEIIDEITSSSHERENTQKEYAENVE